MVVVAKVVVDDGEASASKVVQFVMVSSWSPSLKASRSSSMDESIADDDDVSRTNVTILQSG